MEFDDVVLDRVSLYAPICKEHSESHEIKGRFRCSGGPSEGTLCGVAGCSSQATLYVDFVVDLKQLRNEYRNP